MIEPHILMSEPYMFWYNYINSMKPVQINSDSDKFITSFLSCLSHEIEKSSDPEIRMMKIIHTQPVQETQECIAYFNSLGLFGSHVAPNFDVASQIYVYLVVVLMQHKVITHPLLGTYIHTLHGDNNYDASQSIFTSLCKAITPSRPSNTDTAENYK